MIASRRGVSAFGALLLLTAGCSAGGSRPAAGGSAPAEDGAARRPAGACAVSRDALPAWARTGFRGDGSGVPHVFSEHGDLIAVLFEYPPTASKDPREANKILWVSRPPQTPLQPLTIKAVLDRPRTSVTRVVPGGAGPSGINLPEPGCWRLSLSWSGHTDTMTLRFG